MDGLPPEFQGSYASDFRLADAAFRAGRLAATSIAREARWRNWQTYLAPMGLDPYLQSTTFEQRIRCLTGFAQRVRTGFYGRGRQVQASTVTSAITAVGQTISMAVGNNPTKIIGSEKFLPALQIMIEGYSKEDPPTRKMLPIKTDVPQLLVELGYSESGTAHAQAIGDLTLITFYYLLRIGEYITVKGKRNNTKQTVQFKLEDVTFYKKTSTEGSNKPTRGVLVTYHTCIRRGGRGGKNIHGEVGYKRWVLANGLSGRRGVEFCVRLAATRGRAKDAGNTNIPANGMGRIPPVLLCCDRNSTGHCNGIHRYANRIITSSQIRKIHRVDGESYADLRDEVDDKTPLRSMIEVYVDDFMSLVIPISKSQLLHTATAVMTGIHDVFPANDEDDGDDPISEKKLNKFEGQYSTIKTLLGFDFDGVTKTMWLETAKREKLLTILRGWIRTGHRGAAGIPFKEFESTIAKIRHAFTCIPMGNSLLSACNRILKVKPPFIYLNRNKSLLTSLEGCRTLLRESTNDPTRCRQLIQGWPDYIGFVDASGHGAGGVIIGEQSACTPTVFRWQWPPDIKDDIKTADNPGGHLKFRFGDGRACNTMANHGKSLRTPRGETTNPFQ